MPANLDALCWPFSRLGEGVEELARRAGLRVASGEALAVPQSLASGDIAELDRWMEWAGVRLGIEAEAVETSVADFTQLLRGGGPALFHFKGEQGPCFVLVLASRRGMASLIGPDLKIHRCRIETLRCAICARFEAPLIKEIDLLLATAQVPAQRRQKVRAAMIAERLASQPIAACSILRLAPSDRFWKQLAQAALPRRIMTVLGLFVMVYALEIFGWGVIGKAALNGRLDFGWLTAWVLLVLSIIPLRLLGSWMDATFALDGGSLLKKRLLVGALGMDLETVKHQGAGQLLGSVMESQALESTALNGGMAVLMAGIEMVFAAWILASGAGGALHLFLLMGWLAVSAWLGWRFVGRMRVWTANRLDMTHGLVEKMIGHRTVLAQEWPERRNATEDQAMRDYVQRSRRMDNAMVPVAGLIPGGWMLLGLLGLAPAFIQGAGNTFTLAIGLGGVLLAGRAFSGLSSGFAGLARAGIAWNKVAELFHSGATKKVAGPYFTPAQLDGKLMEGSATKLIDASNLAFRYRPQGEPVLRSVDLPIYRNDRILLEGGSGGGKSTLAALLVGLKKPDSGLLLLHGLDRHTLGESWHQLVTEAPQFHENHILSGTLGFNLLMGRAWPATEDDLTEAADLCRELGLGDLLDRMPSGLTQMVGETGWQLSHGERSRIFLARALLQKAQLTVLDESFAALDPETLDQCLACAFKRAQTLLVIAHP